MVKAQKFLATFSNANKKVISLYLQNIKNYVLVISVKICAVQMCKTVYLNETMIVIFSTVA